MAKIVLGVFQNETSASNSISYLQDLGYNPKDISVMMQGTEHYVQASDKGAKVASGTLQGATAGGVIGALVGVLVATGAIPGLGVLLVGGPLVTTLGLTATAATTVAGAATGIVAGGIIGALTGLGLSSDEARVYEDLIKEGGVLVVVPVKSGDEQKIKNVLADFGADQIKTITQGEVRIVEEEVGTPVFAHDINRKRK